MISAIVLAAGQSKRMGTPKMTLPWGNKTVITKVVATLFDAGLTDINVVVGKNMGELQSTLNNYPVTFVFNTHYEIGEMLSSVKIGLKSIQEKADAGLIVLGDQPNIEPNTIKTIIDTYKNTKKAIIVPSYQRHRGHPFLIDKSCWEEILNLPQDMTLRDFLNSNPQEIYYVNVEDSSILQDMDTPDDYLQQHPYADD